MRYDLEPGRSTLVIEARSSIGPITWESRSLQGWADLAIDEAVSQSPRPSGQLTVDMMDLTSGNTVYDAELLRRIEARRYPQATIELVDMAGTDHPRYQVSGALRFHGGQRTLSGAVEVELRGDELFVSGEHTIDIRDFDVPPPTMMMLKIYPDVHVTFIGVFAPAGEDT